MALKIRLRKQGRTNRVFYRLVVVDSRARRDGKYIEALGWYNPIEQEAEKNLCVKADRVQHWLDQGAQPTEKVVSLIRRAAPQVMQEKIAKDAANRLKKTKSRKAATKAAA